ncbi:MAG: hypothetical protein H6861_04360 [Rhodospirillales bacterium]|nr:hypothetical protein [Rhodospirillales bacterium]
MYQEASTKLELEEIATILDRLNPEFDGSVFDPVETTILAQSVSFYPGYRLFDIADYASVPPLRRFALYSADNFVILNFSNEPIYELNQKLPINLKAENIEDYVRFFFTYVRGRHGRFIIVENVDDIAWKEDPPPSARKAIGQMLVPVTLNEIDKNGYFILDVTMVFKDSLFKSKIKVDPKGFVSLGDEELLVEDMPVLDDTFGQ